MRRPQSCTATLARVSNPTSFCRNEKADTAFDRPDRCTRRRSVLHNDECFRPCHAVARSRSRKPEPDFSRRHSGDRSTSQSVVVPSHRLLELDVAPYLWQPVRHRCRSAKSDGFSHDDRALGLQVGSGSAAETGTKLVVWMEPSERNGLGVAFDLLTTKVSLREASQAETCNKPRDCCKRRHADDKSTLSSTGEGRRSTTAKSLDERITATTACPVRVPCSAASPVLARGNSPSPPCDPRSRDAWSGSNHRGGPSWRAALAPSLPRPPGRRRCRSRSQCPTRRRCGPCASCPWHSGRC